MLIQKDAVVNQMTRACFGDVTELGMRDSSQNVLRRREFHKCSYSDCIMLLEMAAYPDLKWRDEYLDAENIDCKFHCPPRKRERRK